MRRSRMGGLLTTALLVLAACGGGGQTTVGGTVSGLNTGTAVTLQNKGGDNLVVASNGSFEFGPEYSAGESYNVTILVQPAGLACAVANGSGDIDSNASKVSNISVTCGAGLSVGGAVAGLATTGESVTLQNNGVDALTIGANSTFIFPTLLPSGASYAVTVLTAPTGKTCSVTQGTGVVQTVNVTSVKVECTP